MGKSAGKRKRAVLRAVLCMLMSLLPVMTGSAESNSSAMRIEQARIYMPDIKVYYYPGSATSEDVTAMLSDQKLTFIDGYPYSEDQIGTDYYILVDVSLSISKEYFANIKQALVGFPDMMKDADTMTVVTFGDQVSVVLDKARRTDGIGSTLEVIDNADMTTHLFEAFDKTAELVDREENQSKRSVAIVISDGEDCSTNESTKSEALDNLIKAGIPLYGMAVRETAHGETNAFIEDFSDFVRATHGQLSVFGQEEAVSCLQGIQSMLNSAYVLELRASSNRLTSVMESLTLVASGVGSESIEVCPRYSQKDDEAPTAVMEQISEKELKIVYSEPMRGAEEISNYKVTHNGESVPIYVVHYSEAEEIAAVLSFQDLLGAGDYTVEFQNISDNSLEENILSGSVQTYIEGETEPVTELVTERITELMTEPVTEAMPGKNESEFPLWLLGSIVGGLLLIAVIIIAFLKRKKKSEETSTSFSQSILRFMIQGEDGERIMEVPIVDRLTLGRSASCDLSIVDKLLSRQHFTIEKDSGFFYITDLQTTNGTMVNGIRINSRCKLKNGDVIQAGSLHITITW